MRLFGNRIAICLFIILLFFGGLGYYTLSYEKTNYYKDLDKILYNKLTTNHYIDHQIQIAIKQNAFDDAVMYRQLADSIDIQLDKKTLILLKENNTFILNSWRNTKKFIFGFLTGKSDEFIGLSGAIVSDMTLYGDLRDLYSEGNKFVSDKSYDSLVLGMSVIGIGLSASQVFSFGSTTSLKISASIIKVAKKMNYLSQMFIDKVSLELSKAIDFKRLKTIDFSSIEAIKKQMLDIEKTLNKGFIKKAFKNIMTIKNNTSIADTIFLLKYVDTPQDLQIVSNISRKYKHNTKAIFKVLGKQIKSIFKGNLKIIRWTKVLIAQFSSLFLAILMFIFWIRKIMYYFVETSVNVILKIIIFVLKLIVK